MLPSERLKSIDAFVQSADLGSFTAAGRRLNLTNSAVSKSVARLEDRLKCKLFERTTRQLKLTSSGEAFYAVCVRVLADLAEGEAVVSAHEAEPVGRLRINVPLAFGHMQVMPQILAFARRYPKVRPDVSFSDRLIDLGDEGVDLAVRIGGPDLWPAGLDKRFLGAERLILCAAPDFIARHGVPASTADLDDYDAVLYGKADGSTIPWRFARGGDQVERKVMEGRLCVGSAEAQVGAVKAGFGIAQLATWLIHDELQRGELVEILPHASVGGLPLHLVWPQGRHLSPKVGTLIDFLAESLRIQ